MATNYELALTTGLVGGMTVQFAEGRWPSEIGCGLAMSDEAFDIIEPHLRAAASEWTPSHRYGVFEITSPVGVELVRRLRIEAEDHRTRPGAEPRVALLDQLSAWLEARLEDERQVSVLGY